VKQQVISFLVGLMFGIGLAVSGMTNPQIVQGFLDVLGNWDYRLALVMAGAVGVHLAFYRWILGRTTPLLATRFEIPANRQIDRRLLTGAAIFGIGWGLAGFCPGPAITSLASFRIEVLVFVSMMIAGMQLANRLIRQPEPANLGS